jgi:pseudouridine synthase
VTGAAPGGVRLQKLLSQAGVASRRAAEALILQGRVSINGEPVRTLGVRADPGRDDVRVDGRRVRASARAVYVLLNKPAGYMSTRRDPQGRPTVLDLLGGIREYVYPVGRLDYDSEGLLLLTNDGALAARLMHPRHGVARVYEAHVRGVPDQRALRRLEQGVIIDGRRTSPADVELRRRPGRDADRATLILTLREGRNRQVRKMCEAVGHPVVHLRRVRIGPIADRSLEPGRYRRLTAREVEALRAATASAPAVRSGARAGQSGTDRQYSTSSVAARRISSSLGRKKASSVGE